MMLALTILLSLLSLSLSLSLFHLSSFTCFDLSHAQTDRRSKTHSFLSSVLCGTTRRWPTRSLLFSLISHLSSIPLLLLLSSLVSRLPTLISLLSSIFSRLSTPYSHLSSLFFHLSSLYYVFSLLPLLSFPFSRSSFKSIRFMFTKSLLSSLYPPKKGEKRETEISPRMVP